MASLSRTAAAAVVAVRSAVRSAPLTGRVLGAPLPSLASTSAARSARILRRSAAAASAGLETLMPLHSAVAAARLRSCIAVDSTCWSSLSQGAWCNDNILVINRKNTVSLGLVIAVVLIVPLVPLLALFIRKI